MTKSFAVSLALILAAAAPALAISLDTMLPVLTWPEGDLNASTKGTATHP